MTGESDDAAIALGRALFRAPCGFALGAADLGALPADGRPEFCFAGRSNVGKSTLLNALVGRKSLAYASAAPGRTRQLNFYDLGGLVWLADLPGYGFARAPKRESAAWRRLTSAYLAGRGPLLRAYVLIDARRGVGPQDRDFMASLDAAGVSYRCVLTKLDKLRPTERAAPLDRVRAELSRRPAAHPEPLATSARERIGLDALRADVAGLASRA